MGEEAQIESMHFKQTDEDEEWQEIPQPETPREKLYVNLAIAMANRNDRLKRQYQQLNSMVESLEEELDRAKTDKAQSHIELVSLKGEMESVAEEMDGVLKREQNADKRMTSRLIQERAYTHSIDDLITNRNPRNWFRLTWEVVIIFVVLLIAFFEPFRVLVFQNLPIIILGGAILSYLFYRLNQGSKK